MPLDRLTLLDHARAVDPKGVHQTVVEVLSQSNPMFQDAPAYPSNAPMGNRVTLRSSIPTIQWAKVNQGTTRSKASVKQQVDTIGYLAGLSEVDIKLKKIVGAANYEAERMSQDRAFLEAFSQKVAETLLYGDEKTEPAAFTGFAPRLATLASAITGSQVWSNGSVVGGDGTSMIIVDWSQDYCHLIYPERDKMVAGVDVQDKGEMRVEDADGNGMICDVTMYDLMVGLVVKDPRHVARIANIDISDANLASPSQAKLVDTCIDVFTSMPSRNGAKRVAYTHRRVIAGFMKQALNKSNVHLTIDQYLGEPTPHIWGVPIRSMDKMSAAESTVS